MFRLPDRQSQREPHPMQLQIIRDLFGQGFRCGAIFSVFQRALLEPEARFGVMLQV
jgi:hypothetical protein